MEPLPGDCGKTLSRICPIAVRVVETTDDRCIDLFPAEQAAIVRAVDGRRREFMTVRACAREAMAALGLPAAPIVPGEQGAPSWPPGVVGSLTHTAGFRAAAVGLADDVVSVGVDAEPHEPLPYGVLPIIARDDDRAEMPTSTGICWDRLLFCAKEATYKAWFPLTRRFLGFGEVHVRLDPTGRFTARVRGQGIRSPHRWPDVVSGRWTVDEHVLAAAVTILA